MSPLHRRDSFILLHSEKVTTWILWVLFQTVFFHERDRQKELSPQDIEKKQSHIGNFPQGIISLPKGTGTFHKDLEIKLVQTVLPRPLSLLLSETF